MSNYYHYYRNKWDRVTRVSFNEDDDEYIISETRTFSKNCSSFNEKIREAVDCLIEKLRDELGRN